jgi:hypothetical protein
MSKKMFWKIVFNKYPGYLTKVEKVNSPRLTIKQVEDRFKQKRFNN